MLSKRVMSEIPTHKQEELAAMEFDSDKALIEWVNAEYNIPTAAFVTTHSSAYRTEGLNTVHLDKRHVFARKSLEGKWALSEAAQSVLIGEDQQQKRSYLAQLTVRHSNLSTLQSRSVVKAKE